METIGYNQETDSKKDTVKHFQEMFDLPDNITNVLEAELCNNKSDIIEDIQRKFSEVLGNEEKCEVIFNTEAVTNESQLAHYFRNRQSLNNLNNQLQNFFS